MITEAIVSALLGALTSILEAIPNGTIDTGTYLEDFAERVGGALGGLDTIVPVSECMVVVSWVLITYVPMVIAFMVARFVWTYLPVIGNGT